MTPKIIIIRSGELVCETEGIPGETLLQRITAAGLFIDAQCAGMGKCGKCLVRLKPGGEQIRACRTKVDGDIEIYLPDNPAMEIANTGNPAQPPSSGVAAQSTDTDASAQTTNTDIVPPSPNTNATPRPPNIETAPQRAWLGVALDIGTTTIVAHLTDTVTGVRIATASGGNAQRPYGADVISRIRYCAENGHETLTRLIREQIASLIRQTCAASGGQAQDIEYISIAGNTIMQHLAAGYTPVGMGTVPFTPVSLFGNEHPAWEGLPASKSAGVYFAPAISSYVGGDITAGMLAANLEETEAPAIYIDIGTNGEIAMKSGGIYYCCATAAGPAFEGAEITKGMAAVSGAINHVQWDGALKTSVIGDGEPAGICGSGLLDTLAVLLETGAVDKTGRLLDAGEINHAIAAHIGKVDGKNAFLLTRGEDGVHMSAPDIRKLQLAKAAIAAGIQTLLSHAGITQEQVKSFILAGGFGSFMDKYSAARIGLFPKEFLSFAQTMGNTAGEGAALALHSKAARDALERIRKRCEYIELSTNRSSTNNS